MTQEKKLARDPNMVIASEQLFSTFCELVKAGFSKEEAILYLSNLVARLHYNKGK